jgi:hypothetical protein
LTTTKQYRNHRQTISQNQQAQVLLVVLVKLSHFRGGYKTKDRTNSDKQSIQRKEKLTGEKGARAMMK